MAPFVTPNDMFSFGTISGLFITFLHYFYSTTKKAKKNQLLTFECQIHIFNLKSLFGPCTVKTIYFH